MNALKKSDAPARVNFPHLRVFDLKKGCPKSLKISEMRVFIYK
jgi:hypothetical protein